MKKLRKSLTALGLVISMSFISIPCAKADIFGIADGALLSQQILQFFQDAENAKKTINNISDTLADVEDVFNKLEMGKNALATVRSLKSTYDNSVRTVRLISRMQNYAKMFGSDFDIRSIGYLGTSVVYDIENLYDTISEAFYSLSDLIGKNDSAKTSAINEMKESMDKFENYCESRDHGVRHKISEMIKKIANRKSKKEDLDFLKVTVTC